ncbi:MAG TPA: cupin domain-containing protein [Nocardioides sp.]|uniref:cupin domain-containing protein n=1 Tax=Nocardioides sp. TaxID=35761 RepID=UPI002BB25767|nr:cupin domain-containing protein [Nocardioides sp.]HQR28722.1 cupin domain-containing protein [Nocardioides sp.]
MTSRYVDVDVFSTELPRQRIPAEETIDGFPTAGARALAGVGSTEIGIYEISPGMARDVECDEVFVVLSGRGSVEFEDGEVVPLAPGTVVRLHKGDKTIWHISETLRKVYIAG